MNTDSHNYPRIQTSILPPNYIYKPESTNKEGHLKKLKPEKLKDTELHPLSEGYINTEKEKNEGSILRTLLDHPSFYKCKEIESDLRPFIGKLTPEGKEKFYEISSTLYEISSKMKDFSILPMSTDIAILKEAIKEVERLKTDLLALLIEAKINPVANEISSGAAKSILLPTIKATKDLPELDGKVINVAKKDSKLQELEDEFKTTQEIKAKLQFSRLKKTIINFNSSISEEDSHRIAQKILNKHPDIAKLLDTIKSSSNSLAEVIGGMGLDKREKIIVTQLLTSKDQNIIDSLTSYQKYLHIDWEEFDIPKLSETSQSETLPVLKERSRTQETITQSVDRKAFINSKATCDLEDALDRKKEPFSKKPLTSAERIDICEQLMQCLADLHEAGFSHGDIKADNFLLFVKIDEQGNRTIQVKLADFGKASVEEKMATGNPRYRLAGEPQSQKSDVYGLQFLFTEILEGPFVEKSKMPIVNIEESERKAPNNDKFGMGYLQVRITSFLFSQIDSSTLMGKIRLILGFAKNIVKKVSTEAIEREVDANLKYVASLNTRISQGNHDIYSKEEREKACNILACIPFMAIGDPKQRFKMADTIEEYNRFKNNNQQPHLQNALSNIHKHEKDHS